MCGCRLGRKQGGEVAVQAGEAEPRPPEPGPGEPSAIERLILSERDDFPLEQSRDETLKHAFEQVCSIDGQPLQSARPLSYPYFAVLKDRLYRVTQDTQTKQDTTQLLVPKSRREMLFQAAHYNPMAGHLGQTATPKPSNDPILLAGHSRERAQVVRGLSWVSVSESPGLPKSAFAAPPSVQVPFDRIGMDLIGPLERSARGHRFALVLVDYATRYPEAVALRSISAKSVAEALFRIISEWESRKRFSRIKARRLCHVQFASFTSYWALSQFAPAFFTHKRTAWWNDLIALWKPWFVSSFMRTQKIGTSGWNPFCSRCARSRKPPRGFPPSSSSTDASPGGFGCHQGNLGGGTFREQERNSACAGPENKTPHFGAALDGEFVTGPGQAKPIVQSGCQATQIHTGRESACIAPNC